jgi:negative regulator of flagellin synthesis FlgM
MKITHNKVGQNLNLRDTNKSESLNKVGNSSDIKPASNHSTDISIASKEVEFSPRAQQFQKAKEAALNAPDVNREKVERLKKMVQDGTYKVDADAVADRMLSEHLEW